VSAPSAPAERLYGLMAEFHGPAEVVAAAHAVHEAGYRRVDAYTPYPIEELTEALDLHHSPLPKLVFAGGTTGLLAGFGLAYWASTIAYPMNIGGRPFNSWVSFIPPTFETTILFSALTCVLGMLALNGLPEPYHPVFNVEAFALASRDKFFICIEAADAKFDREETRKFLRGLADVSAVHEVTP
jgi:ActD protein